MAERDKNSSASRGPGFLETAGYVLVCFVVLVAAMELVATGLIAFQEHRRSQHLADTFAAFRCRGTKASRCVPRDLVDLESASPVYEGQPWADAVWHDFRILYARGFPYHAFVEWAAEEFHGEAVNVDSSPLGEVRRTVAAANACPEPERKIVWLLGASAAFGWGVPDSETIASHLVTELRKQNPCVDVLNLAVAGYDSNQELLQTMLQLKRGSPPAAIVIFDGYNDGIVGVLQDTPSMFLSYAAAVAKHDHSEPSFARWVSSTNLARATYALLHRLHLSAGAPQFQAPNGQLVAGEASSASELQRRAAATLDNYEANLRALRVLADAYHFRLIVFWQPSLLYGHKPMDDFERRVAAEYTSGTDSAGGAAQRALYAEAEARAARSHDFVFLGSLLDATPQSVYMDPVHMGPIGNALAAKAMAAEMERQAVLAQRPTR